MVLDGLKSLRDGLLEHKDSNAAQEFDENGALLHTLEFASDNGGEFKGGFSATRLMPGVKGRIHSTNYG